MSGGAFTAGTVLDGKYELVRPLGSGGMGVIYLARHVALDQQVAVKILKTKGSIGGVATKRFLREAKLAAKLRGQHVARVVDFSAANPEAPYLVIEYLEGTDLSALVDRRGALPWATAVDYVLQALVGLAEAHALGIVHRDLKPANLFLARDPDGHERVKVLDFGLSKSVLSDAGDVELTQTAVLLGTPAFAAPEVLLSARKADVRSDVWAMGATLYRLVTARLPFEGTPVELLAPAILRGAAVPPRRWVPELPEGLEQAILRAIAGRPEARFQNVAELAAAITPFGPPEAAALTERITRLLGMAQAPSFTSEAPGPSDAGDDSGGDDKTVPRTNAVSVTLAGSEHESLEPVGVAAHQGVVRHEAARRSSARAALRSVLVAVVVLAVGAGALFYGVGRRAEKGPRAVAASAAPPAAPSVSTAPAPHAPPAPSATAEALEFPAETDHGDVEPRAPTATPPPRAPRAGASARGTQPRPPLPPPTPRTASSIRDPGL